jgi:hypothetical protein
LFGFPRFFQKSSKSKQKLSNPNKKSFFIIVWISSFFVWISPGFLKKNLLWFTGFLFGFRLYRELGSFLPDSFYRSFLSWDELYFSLLYTSF